MSDVGEGPQKPKLTSEIQIDYHTVGGSYGFYFERVKEENSLIHNRTVWLVTIQSFMIAGVSLVYSYYMQTFIPLLKDIDKKSKFDIHQIKKFGEMVWTLLMVSSSAGVFLSAVSIALIVTAAWSIETLEVEWKRHGLSNVAFTNNRAEWKFMPGLTNGRDNIIVRNGLLLAILMPSVFFAMWIGLAWVFSQSRIKF